jgi:glycosyltransferase involved in cell wall biosynthesis
MASVLFYLLCVFAVFLPWETPGGLDCDFGPREILAWGKYGKLVPVGDAEALAVAIRSTLSEPRTVVPEEAIDLFRVEGASEEYLKVLLGDVHA